MCNSNECLSLLGSVVSSDFYLWLSVQYSTVQYSIRFTSYRYYELLSTWLSVGRSRSVQLQLLWLSFQPYVPNRHSIWVLCTCFIKIFNSFCNAVCCLMKSRVLTTLQPSQGNKTWPPLAGWNFNHEISSPQYCILSDIYLMFICHYSVNEHKVQPLLCMTYVRQVYKTTTKLLYCPDILSQDDIYAANCLALHKVQPFIMYCHLSDKYTRLQ